MKQTYIKTLIINLFIILGVFIGFIFIDTNTSPASDEMGDIVIPRMDDLGESYATRLSNAGVDEERLPFDWSPLYYLDENTLNMDSSYKNVLLSDSIHSFAFYSHRQAYYRFEVAEFHLLTREDIDNFSIRVSQNGTALPSYNGPEWLIWREGDSTDEWVAYWLYDWTTPTGTYQAELYIDDELAESESFDYIAREQLDFNRAFTAVNLESNSATYERKAYNSSYGIDSFTNVLTDWMDYGEIDVFLNLSGETTGWNNISPESPWEYYCVRNLEEIGQAVHNAGKAVGAYVMCFYTPENGHYQGGYEPATGVAYSTNGGYYYSYDSLFISFQDEKRFNDIVNLMAYFNELDYVDMIGFDFIRFGENAGFENYDRFMREMNIEEPSGWDSYSESDKILWLGKKIRYSGDSDMVEQWRLWKAHMTAEFIYLVRREANLTKPIWAFTLGWDHGTEHGQDPLMMVDAGLVADFPMMYEATPSMFDNMTIQWKKYLDNEELNYVPGNQLDAVVNASEDDRNSVEEYAYRLKTAVDFADYSARGVFIHDMIRAFWGRKGDYGYAEWIWSGLSSVSYVRYQRGEIPFKVTFPQSEYLSAPGEDSITIPYDIEIKPEYAAELTGKSLIIESGGQNFLQKVDINGETDIRLYTKIEINQSNEVFLALKVKCEGYPAYFTFQFPDLKPDVES